MKKAIIILMIIISFFTLPVCAGSASTYNTLYVQNDEFINKLYDGGLEYERIEAFLNSVDSEVSTLNIPESRENMEQYFLCIVFNVVLENEEFWDVCAVFDEVFQEEFNYMIENDMKLPEIFENMFLISMGDLIKEEDTFAGDDGPVGEEVVLEEITEEAPTTPVIEEEHGEEFIFSDITGFEWAKDYILSLYEKEIISGYDDMTFHPGESITRAQAVKIVSKAFLKSGYVVIQSDFFDISKDDWFYKYVVNGEYYSIFSGVFRGSDFEKDKPVTRQEFCTLAYRAYINSGRELRSKKRSQTFLDFYDILPYAEKPIDKLQRGGIINGRNNGFFFPKQPVTRAEASKIISLLLESDNK